MIKSGKLYGCLTAIVTPLNEDYSLDLNGLEKNLTFQIQPEIMGLVPVGTTGESPTLTPEEQFLVIAKAHVSLNSWKVCLAGCGSNSTEKALHFAKAAQAIGCYGALLVDPYYNGPSSLEIRERYYLPIAEAFPELAIVPYVIPGRTGCALSPEDLAVLANQCPNVVAVKEATGDLDRMAETKKLVPDYFQILSGDDDKTFAMMTDERIEASGVISVVSNIAPFAVSKMCAKILEGKIGEAVETRLAIEPLFGIVTVIAKRYGIIRGREMSVVDRFRNPLPIKTAMQGLGMPAGPCRPPLGRMTRGGVEVVRKALQKVWQENPWVLKPIEEHYDVDIEERLKNDKIWHQLAW